MRDASPGNGGASGTGGAIASGGDVSSGGSPGRGGQTGSGTGATGGGVDTTSPGGSPATGGGATGGISSGTGGVAATGGTATGGAAGSGGSGPSGGTVGRDGSAGRDGASGTGGSGRDAANTDGSPADGRSDSGRDGAGSGGVGTGGATGAGGSTTPPAMTLWIAGDSTVKTYPAGNTSGANGAELEGWGQEIGQFFSSKVTVNNQAIGGRSVAMFMWSTADTCADATGTPTFLLDGTGNKIDTTFWSNIKKGIKAGDFLLVQFGHNDETNTCPRHVSIADYETYLGFMADTVIAKGATPIFVTPMGHRTFTGTKFNNTLLPYANAMKDEASKKHIEIEDLNLRSGEYYESVGTTYLATKIFDGGTTHFIKAGAIKMAELIVGEIRKNEGPLSAYLK